MKLKTRKNLIMLSFELEERENQFAIFHCHSSAVGAHGVDFVRLLMTQVSRLSHCPTLKIVIDLKDKSEFDSETLDRISAFAPQLQKSQRKLFFVNVPLATANLVKSMGLDSVIHILFSSPVPVVPEGPATVLEKEAPLLVALQEGLLGVCSMFCPSLQFQPGKAYVKNKSQVLPGDVTSLLKLRSKTFDGEVLLSFQESTYLKIVSAMHETKYTNLSAVADDGASEMLNILRSLSRKRLWEKGYVFDKEIPSVTRGDLAQKLLQHHETVIVLPLESAEGKFYCQIGMTPRKISV